MICHFLVAMVGHSRHNDESQSKITANGAQRVCNAAANRSVGKNVPPPWASPYQLGMPSGSEDVSSGILLLLWVMSYRFKLLNPAFARLR